MRPGRHRWGPDANAAGPSRTPDTCTVGAEAGDGYRRCRVDSVTYSAAAEPRTTERIRQPASGASAEAGRPSDPDDRTSTGSPTTSTPYLLRNRRHAPPARSPITPGSR